LLDEDLSGSSNNKVKISLENNSGSSNIIKIEGDDNINDDENMEEDE
jgi:hypothetical protein